MNQTIVVLGGGRHVDGGLTSLSLQRLDEAVRLWNKEIAPSITILGESRSTYLPNAIVYDQPGAQVRADYLIAQGIPAKHICQIRGGRDTIGEALAAKAALPGVNMTQFVLVTSTLHMPRAHWLFETILGGNYKITPHGVDCGGLLLEKEERDYRTATKTYLQEHPGCLDAPGDWQENNQALYAIFKAIHDKHHPPGKPSEAYLAVHKRPMTQDIP